MNKSVYPRPGLCLDFKQARIRIHKPTLNLLGNPTRINLLINPVKGIIAIKTASIHDHLSLKVSKKSLATDGCYELHSKVLMEQLIAVYNGWKYNNSYRIYGRFDDKNQLTVFSASDSVLLEDGIYPEKIKE